MTSGSGWIGHGGSRKSKPYRKYRPLPALIVIGLLGVISVFVWLNVIVRNNDLDDAVRCEPPAAPPQGTVYTSLGHSGLGGTSPIPPDKVAVTVLNASGARNQAAMTTEALRKLGFTQVGEPANDPAYAKREAVCHGQIRFGENGEAAARTLSLVDPCFELVRDGRKDASVDLAIGTTFTGVRPPPQAEEILDELATWSERHGSTGGGEQATGEQAPTISPERISEARQAHC
ncbi:envelope integrity protein Cei [Amycolatopsis aidingensis]|uniref:envelope integrity protein Cei n=1 Tax=Amycolatopsis aidingensis TaxID=2842453 RepID=UPI001E481CB0|nr:envelope integrity protein Cei [Amycolatopsis aidingensis]